MIPCSSDWFNSQLSYFEFYQFEIDFRCFFGFFIEGDTYNATTADMAWETIYL